MTRKILVIALLALLTLPLSGCYTMGYVTGKAVGTILPPGPVQ